MVRVRCTQRVLDRFGLKPSPASAPSTTLLGDWYANLLNAGRSRWVLCVSERTLLPVILPARKATFPSALPTSLRAVLEGLGDSPVDIDREVSEMERVEIDRTRSRRVLGVMNDFSLAAEIWLRDGVGPLAVALKVAETPSKPLNYDSPERVTRSLFASHLAG
jgi:hypothetical protein